MVKDSFTGPDSASLQRLSHWQTYMRVHLLSFSEERIFQVYPFTLSILDRAGTEGKERPEALQLGSWACACVSTNISPQHKSMAWHGMVCRPVSIIACINPQSPSTSHVSILCCLAGNLEHTFAWPGNVCTFFEGVFRPASGTHQWGCYTSDTPPSFGCQSRTSSWQWLVGVLCILVAA